MSSQEATRALSVVVPVFDEEAGLVDACTEIHDTLRARGYALELLIVDDCSRDRSHELACRFAETRPDVRVLRHPRNLGPCSGLATGARAARHEWVLLLPCDIAIPLEDVDRLWQARAGVDVVVGYLRDGAERSWRRRLQSRVYTRIVNALFGMALPQVNYVSLYRREIFDRIELTTEGVARHAEILVRARALGYRLGSAALGYRPRVRGAASGSKPRVIAKTVWEVLKLRAEIGRGG